MDRQHLVSDSAAEIGLHILSKTTNFDYEIDQFLRLHELPSLFDWVRRWARLSTKPYSERLATYVEYEHGVKARLEHGIWARSTEYGFITSAHGHGFGEGYFSKPASQPEQRIMWAISGEMVSIPVTWSHIRRVQHLSKRISRMRVHAQWPLVFAVTRSNVVSTLYVTPGPRLG